MMFLMFASVVCGLCSAMSVSVTGSSATGQVAVDREGVDYRQAASGDGRFSVTIGFPEWEKDTWVFMPACAYNGNRDARCIEITDCLRVGTKAGRGPEPVLEQTKIPALAADGSGVLEVTSGDMATPCAGFFFPKARRAVLIFTEQEVGGRNLGYCVRSGSLRIDYPANRRRAYRFCQEPECDVDRPLSLSANDRLKSRLRIVEFEASDVSVLLERFFRERKSLLSGVRPPNGYTPGLWQTVEKSWNENCWIGGTYRQEISKWVSGWTGGAASIYPLYKFGDARTRERCRASLDFMMRHQAACGLFYGTVIGETNAVDEATCGPLDEPNRLLVRRSAEALYFLVRCGRVMGWKESWKEGCRRCADALVGLWRRHGQFGQWVDIEDGRLLVGRSTSCAIVSAALLEAWRTFGDAAYRTVAFEACEDYCRRDLDRGVTYGGPADIIMAPDSESAFALLESCVALAEETREEKWIRRARQAAALCSTWVVSYPYRFPEASTFAKMRINTVGAVFASVQNKHAAPGICTLSGDSLLRLYRLTGDAAYLDLCKDIAFFIPQLVSRPDAPVFAKGGEALPAGFISERVNMSDWEGFDWVGETFKAFCWCGTALTTTWADLVGQPEFQTGSDYSLEIADRHVEMARKAYACAVCETSAYANTVLDAPELRVEYDRQTDVLKDESAFGRRTWRSGRVRWIAVEGAANVRDAGGWNGLKGGLLYRGSELDSSRKQGLDPNNPDKSRFLWDATDAGLRVLRDELHIACDLDLRGVQAEIRESPLGPAVRHLFHPIQAYTNFLTRIPVSSACLRAFADRTNYPMYVHCAGGADRTGTVIFLIQGLCGVSEADLCADYELTSYELGRRDRCWSRYAFNAFVTEIKKFPGKTLQDRIEYLFLNRFGITADEIRAIRSILCKD